MLAGIDSYLTKRTTLPDRNTPEMASDLLSRIISKMNQHRHILKQILLFPVTLIELWVNFMYDAHPIYRIPVNAMIVLSGWIVFLLRHHIF